MQLKQNVSTLHQYLVIVNVHDIRKIISDKHEEGEEGEKSSSKHKLIVFKVKTIKKDNQTKKKMMKKNVSLWCSTLVMWMVLVATVDVNACPSDGPCIGCNQVQNCSTEDCDSASKSTQRGCTRGVVENELKVLTNATTFTYRVVFHSNTLTYPCDIDTWCSNVNKLFGFILVMSFRMASVLHSICMYT
ncbi:hypothetical protein RFI_05852 [Reticulomyxa filosa]|uniref:Uncharacterized protein n=1 Tax=Reticulomyxa filosa TaxID=46433 RepID=X6NZG1_RETFI|nr:hypothetical protein RFI_05852 [Reticulomyxa filosa]|eukprot:ETO31268.1 hypothetical protein RFI_05852 [Reticulomyxa filosa]